jgi:purine-binding chemotaxis protein CheW
MNELQAVVFYLNGIKCGAQTAQIQEIIPHQEINSISEMPKCIDGVIDLRGKNIPVINLNKRFKTGDHSVTKKTKIIVSNVSEMNIAFLVNEVSEIQKFSKDDMDEPSEILKKVSKDYISCIGKKDQELLIILDLQKVLSEKEIGQLQKTR